MAHRSSCRLRRLGLRLTGDGVTVFESIMSFQRPESAESWVAAFESCPNQWKEEGDPDEYITVEPVEIADLGEDAAGFVLLYEHSSSVDTEHSTGVAFVRISPSILVQLFVDVFDDSMDPTAPYDPTLLNDIAAIAAVKAQSVMGLQ